MKAIMVKSWDGLKSEETFGLETIEFPTKELESNEVMINVKAFALNPIDSKIAYVKPFYTKKLPYPLGMDASGVVMKKGKCVKNVEIGDSVLVNLNGASGAASEYIVVKSNLVAKTRKDFTTAAASALVSVTAYDCIEKLALPEGSRVLITGASGGVGQCAVQIAAMRGLHVIAVCSAKNEEFVKKMGAKEVIDYKTQDYVDVLKSNKVDGFVDLMSDYDKSSLVLKESGPYVTVNSDSIPTSYVSEVSDHWSFKSAIFNLGNLAQMLWFVVKTKMRSNYSLVLAHSNSEKLAEIEKMDLKIRIQQIFKAEEIHEAVKCMKHGAQGKVVVQF